MKTERLASVPIVVHDPYFSIWSGADCLYDKDTEHWCGARQTIRGYVMIDGVPYCFMGDKELHQVIRQVGLTITPTATEYVFENQFLTMTVRFTSPLLLDDMILVSRPCTYIDVSVVRKCEAEVRVLFQLSSDLVKEKDTPVNGGSYSRSDYHYGVMGNAYQHPLGHSGDHTTIDWGYIYLASAQPYVAFSFDSGRECLEGQMDLGTELTEGSLVIAYDDTLSINYFGQWRKAYWTKTYATILEAIAASLCDRETVLARSRALDQDLYSRAEAAGGEDYALLCSLSYRQSIGAHKLIEDEEGNILFLSKENDSNGCIGTVDISYPSVPLYLLYNDEYVKGMLRPIFRFASCDAWNYEFAPHDVGRYPYAYGQVYGLNQDNSETGFHRDNGAVFPPYYQYPACGIYDFKDQMPVEECGNMLIMTALCCELDQSPAFARPYEDILRQWAQYLITYGADPGEQLCTDDFAGHLAHNTNLSVKAIVGIKAYASILEKMGLTEEAAGYMKTARDMAASWEERADAKDHYRLTFDQPDSWSLKYNLIWDKFFGDAVFSGEIIRKELDYYLTKSNTYGVPLDSRKSYTKSDWICWCAAMTESESQFKAFIGPIAEYVRNTEDRVPFSDWYETVSGNYCHFIGRSVQGGVFMPLFVNKS